ncbi:MAG: ATP-binding protein [Saprospiraceae bacterium]
MFGILLGIRNNKIYEEKIILEQKTSYYQQLNQFKSHFFTNFTHEFRTPLTVIKGMANELKAENKIKQLINKNSDRLLSLVNQLLDLAKLESQSIDINWTNGDVVPYLKYLTESCQSLANSRKITLTFATEEESLKMDYDEVKMEQILINLISNAIKFTPESGLVRVKVAKEVIHQLPYLGIRIEDTGSGIPEDQLPFIFDRFYQVTPDSRKKHEVNNSPVYREGFGIGLSLVKELTTLLSGTVRVSSNPDRGTCFHIQLPIRNVAIPPQPVIKQQLLSRDQSLGERNSEKSDQEKPVILVIEDNEDVISYILTCLESNYRTISALSGKQGIVKAVAKIPDVIICDVMMPEMDGFEVCRNLKKDSRTSHIPIILLTAKATDEDRIKGLSQGADAYLIKPFNKEELIIRLKNLSKQSKLLRDKLTSPKTSSAKSDPIASREMKFLDDLNHIIMLNIGNEQFNTHALCREMAMSRTQLHRKLKAITGHSTANYLRRVRLMEAKNLLETTELPIGEIASRVGFLDFSHFSRSFHQAFRLRPSDIRK